MKITDKYVLFWSGIFSNFARTEYVSHDGISFCCSEQEFMYRKAIHFNDIETSEKILAARDPKEIKALGRQVKNFTEDEWSRVSKDYMFRACLSKFSQVEKARKAILSYPGLQFVEASPYDRIWGIGLSESDALALDSSTWRGSNWLGQVLDSVRRLIESESE